MTYHIKVNAFDIKGNELNRFGFYSNTLLDKDLIIYTMFDTLMKSKHNGNIKVINYLDYYYEIPTNAPMKDFMYLDYSLVDGKDYYIYTKGIKISCEVVK